MHNAFRKAETLFNDRFLPKEAQSVRAEVRAFAEKALAPRAHALNTASERSAGFPREMFDLIAKAGLYELPYPKDVGGRGLEHPTLATVIVLEELGYYCPGVASALFDGQAILVGQTLNRSGARLRNHYLPKLVRGEFVGSFATSEPAASTDLSPNAMLTRAEPVEGGYRITGRKRWITNSVAADYIALLCRTGDRQTFFFVDMKAPGVSVGTPDLKMGNRAQVTADVIFENVFVPTDHILGEVGGGLKSALGALTLGRMGIGAIGNAMAMRAFDVAAHHIGQRQVFGRPVASFQHWQFRFADHAMQIEQARSLCYKAAMLYDLGELPETEAAMAKIAGSELAVNVARDAIQACGAYGFVESLGADPETWMPLEGIYRDAKIGEIYEGPNEVQRWIVARRIFGRNVVG